MATSYSGGGGGGGGGYTFEIRRPPLTQKKVPYSTDILAGDSRFCGASFDGSKHPGEQPYSLFQAHEQQASGKHQLYRIRNFTQEVVSSRLSYATNGRIGTPWPRKQIRAGRAGMDTRRRGPLACTRLASCAARGWGCLALRRRTFPSLWIRSFIGPGHASDTRSGGRASKPIKFSIMDAR